MRKQAEGARGRRKALWSEEVVVLLTRRRWKRAWLSLKKRATQGVRGWYATVPMAEYATGRERPSEGF